MKPLVYVFSILIAVLVVATYATAKQNDDKVIVCYVASWAYYRPNAGKFDTKDLRPELCTHLVYAFAGLDTNTWTIKPLDPWRDLEINGIGNYRAMTNLRQKYPELTVSLAVGGWNEGSKNYSELVKYPERRAKFVDSVVDIIGKYKFNGFDLDWEFPGDRGGDDTDKENFVLLVKELKSAFKGRYHLSAAISANEQTISKGYNLPELSKYLDHIHVMTYDYHTSWERKVLPNAPLRSNDNLSVISTLEYLLKNGAPANKLVMGLAFYGRTFELEKSLPDTIESPIGANCTPEGFKGPYTGQNGFMGYNEICEELVKNPHDWKTGWHPEGLVPYMINDKRVIIYDDLASITHKVELANNLNLGGVMIWSIDTDDFHGKCATLPRNGIVSNTDFPLMRAIRSALINLNQEEITTKKPNSSAARYQFCHLLFLLSLLAIYT